MAAFPAMAGKGLGLVCVVLEKRDEKVGEELTDVGKGGCEGDFGGFGVDH